MNDTTADNWLTNNPCRITGTAVTTNLNSGYSGAINAGGGTSLGTTNINGGNGTTVTTISTGSGLTLQGNSTINYSTNQFQNNMKPTQVKVAVFEITRDEDTNEINSTKFLKELWVEVKNGASIDLIVAKHLDKDFNPETTIIKVLLTVSF